MSTSKGKHTLMKFHSERTFGVEMEWARNSLIKRARMASLIKEFPIHSDQKEKSIVTGYRRNANRDTWYCKTDSSCGYEVASRVLGGSADQNIKDLDLLIDIHRTLVSYGAKVRPSCGTHVHLHIEDVPFYKLLQYWVKFEKITFDMLPLIRKESGYCRNLSRRILANQKLSEAELRSQFSGRLSLNLSRYTLKKTVEVRCFEGTEDYRNLRNLVIYLLHFMEMVKTRMPEPENLNWLSLEQGLELLGLLDRSGNTILDPTLSELRHWMLARTAAYSNFRDAVRNRQLAEKLQEQLYGGPYGCEEIKDA